MKKERRDHTFLGLARRIYMAEQARRVVNPKEAATTMGKESKNESTAKKPCFDEKE